MPGCTQRPNHDQPVEPGHARLHAASEPRPTGRAGPCPAARSVRTTTNRQSRAMPGCTQPSNHDHPVEPAHARLHAASEPRPTGRAGPCPAALLSPSKKTSGRLLLSIRPRPTVWARCGWDAGTVGRHGWRPRASTDGFTACPGIPPAPRQPHASETLLSASHPHRANHPPMKRCFLQPTHICDPMSQPEQPSRPIRQHPAHSPQRTITACLSEHRDDR